MKKRIAAMLFATVMLFSCFTTIAFAAEVEVGATETTYSDVAPDKDIPDGTEWKKISEEDLKCPKKEHAHSWSDRCYTMVCSHEGEHECDSLEYVFTCNGKHKGPNSHQLKESCYEKECIKNHWFYHDPDGSCLVKKQECSHKGNHNCNSKVQKTVCTKELHKHDATCDGIEYTWELVWKTYEIIWNPNNGDPVKTMTVQHAVTPTYGENPTKGGDAQFSYKFIGWTPEIAPATGNATYTATYKETVNEYPVTWYDEDGETVLDQQKVKYGEKAVYAGKEPTKAADNKYTYKFAGWEKIEPKASENDATVAQEVAAEDEKDVVTGETAYKATYTATEIPAKDDAAKTGDNMNPAIYFGLMLFAALGMMAVVLKKRNA